MKLTHLNLEDLKLSTINVRKKGGKDVSDLLPSIRSLGIVQPLLVRPNCEGYEIIAGQRRFRALEKLAEEGITEPVPCAIMEDGDDAKAIEASLAENVARLPMDEIDQYKAFAALHAKGESIEDIAARFGVTERLVNQRLAIAGIIEPILNAYRRGEIGPDTLRTLTMATKRQQQAWFKLYKSEDEYAPQGRALRQWLFGGSQIPVTNALFDLDDYTGTIVSDLFGEDRYFADAEAFWQLQSKAVAEKQAAYLEKGWSDVVVLDTGRYFATWEHTKVPKTKGGKVFVTITNDGEVTFHEGWLSTKEVRKEKAESAEHGEAKAKRPELTKAMRNYIGLHKHAAVRTELLAHPGIALRLAVAHIIAGSSLWNVSPEDQRADNDAIRESLAASLAEQGFAGERAKVRALLGIEEDESGESVVPARLGFHTRNLGEIFDALLHMEDSTVQRILAYVMAETLEAHSGTVEALGMLFQTDMRNWWKPEGAFFDLLRDKTAINGMVRELAGDACADAHLTSTAKVQKKIVADCLDATRECRTENWLPRYFTFPETLYKGE
jgi:ParB family chromosome partitioning protein